MFYQIFSILLQKYCKSNKIHIFLCFANINGAAVLFCWIKINKGIYLSQPQAIDAPLLSIWSQILDLKLAFNITS